MGGGAANGQETQRDSEWTADRQEAQRMGGGWTTDPVWGEEKATTHPMPAFPISAITVGATYRPTALVKRENTLSRFIWPVSGPRYTTCTTDESQNAGGELLNYSPESSS